MSEKPLKSSGPKVEQGCRTALEIQGEVYGASWKGLTAERDALRASVDAFQHEVYRLHLQGVERAQVQALNHGRREYDGVVVNLLAALKTAEGHLSETLADKQWHPIGHCPVLDVVRAAIAKAEGASSAPVQEES